MTQIDDQQIEQSETWLNNHGLPSADYLLKLGKDGTSLSKEELMSIADKYNIDYTSTTKVSELVAKINMAMEGETDNRQEQ